MSDLAKNFAEWESRIKTEVKNSPIAPTMPGPIARLYFSPGGVVNPENLPTRKAVERWASKNGFSCAYDKGVDEYVFYISPTKVFTEASKRGIAAMIEAMISKDGTHP